MQLNICDLCKRLISEHDDVFVSAILTKNAPMHLFMPAPPDSQRKLDICIPCAVKGGILKSMEVITHNTSQLTEDELKALGLESAT